MALLPGGSMPDDGRNPIPLQARLATALSRFDSRALYALAESLGSRKTRGKYGCPLPECKSPGSFTVSALSAPDASGARAVWTCAACEHVGDAALLLCEVKGCTLDAAADLLLAFQIPKGAQPPVDGLRAWDELAGLEDPDAWEWLHARGLEEAAATGLARCNLGRSHDPYVNWLAEGGYRLALALRDSHGEVRSFVAQHLGTMARPSRAGDGTPLPERMPLRGASRGLWLGAPETCPDADVVVIAEGLDALALHVASLDEAGAALPVPLRIGLIGATTLASLQAVLPALGVIDRRTFVLCPRRENSGESMAAFARLRESLTGNGGDVRVYMPGGASAPVSAAGGATESNESNEPPAGPLEVLRALGAEGLAAEVLAVATARKQAKAERPLAPVIPIRGGPEDPGGDALSAFKPWPLTDLGNAERLVARHGQDLRFVHDWKRWHRWDGTRWLDDRKGGVRNLCHDVVRTIPDEAKWTPDPEEKDEIGKWAKASEGHGHLRSMLEVSQTLGDIPVVPEDFDRDPWLLNVLNGTLDLRTGTLQPHTRADMMSKMAPVAFDPDATCPRWERFLLEIFDGDAELAAFMQRAAGYAMTGITREHCLFLLYGEGRNGKGTWRNIVGKILGDYNHDAQFSTFEPSKNGDTGQPREDLVALFGMRFVGASESNKERRIDEALIKQLTGEDKVRARRLNENGFVFRPVAKYFLLVNHEPKITGTDTGIWARIRKIPFEVEFSEANGNLDRDLEGKLTAELPGILNWMLRGCLEWQATGLAAPAKVRLATEAYRQEQDVIGQWMAECVIARTGAFASTKALYESYTRWIGHGRPMTDQAFSKELRKSSRLPRLKGVPDEFRGRKRGWLHIGIIGEPVQDNLPGAPPDDPEPPPPDAEF